jgi:hypothetical protein
MTFLLRPVGGVLLVLAAVFASAHGQILLPQSFSCGPQPNRAGTTTAASATFTAQAWWLGPYTTSSLNSSTSNSSHSNSSSAVSQWLLGPFAYGPPRYGTTISGGTLQLGSNSSSYFGGGGTVCLTGSNTYTGGSYSGATMITGGSFDYGTGGTYITYGTGGTTVSGGSLVLNNVNLLGGSISPSFTGSISGGLILTNSGAMPIGSSLTVGDQPTFLVTNDGSDLTVGTNTSVFSNQADPGPPTVHTLSTVPEPGTLALLALAAGTVLLCPRPLRLFARPDR